MRSSVYFTNTHLALGAISASDACLKLCYPGPWFVFESYNNKAANDILFIFLNMIGNVEHFMDELSGRQIEGEERKVLRNTFASKLPREQYIENIAALPSEVLASGCRDACPNKNVLKQVRHEAREIESTSKDEWEALFAIRKEQLDTSGHRVKETLQIITMHPKGIILFSEKLVRLYHHVAKHDTVYIDATGSILLGDKHCYAYEIVIRHHTPETLL